MDYQSVNSPGLPSLQEYIHLRRQQPYFANARSIRNALDRARLRQANRLIQKRGEKLTRDMLATISKEDIRASRVFTGGANATKGTEGDSK